jgi:hypothetical protein
MKNRGKQKEDAPIPAQTGAERSANAALPGTLSRRRRWCYRLAAATLIPLTLVVGLEVALRLAGVGYPCQFFLRDTVGGRPVWMANQKYGWRFFPRRMARTPDVTTIPANREPGVRRVFILGESAAYGDPTPDFGLPRVLEVL